MGTSLQDRTSHGAVYSGDGRVSEAPSVSREAGNRALGSEGIRRSHREGI